MNIYKYLFTWFIGLSLSILIGALVKILLQEDFRSWLGFIIGFSVTGVVIILSNRFWMAD